LFIKKYGWDEEQAKNYNTIISSISVVGLAIGSIIAGKVVGLGRRNCILMFECFVFIAVLFTMVQSLCTLCLGRFMFGISGGVLNVVMSISMNETIPIQL
jgi:MFS family permease